MSKLWTRLYSDKNQPVVFVARTVSPLMRFFPDASHSVDEENFHDFHLVFLKISFPKNENYSTGREKNSISTQNYLGHYV